MPMIAIATTNERATRFTATTTSIRRQSAWRRQTRLQHNGCQIRQDGDYPYNSSRSGSRLSARAPVLRRQTTRSEEHTSELQSLMRISYAVFCLKKKKKAHIE